MQSKRLACMLAAAGLTAAVAVVVPACGSVPDSAVDASSSPSASTLVAARVDAGSSPAVEVRNSSPDAQAETLPETSDPAASEPESGQAASNRWYQDAEAPAAPATPAASASAAVQQQAPANQHDRAASGVSGDQVAESQPPASAAKPVGTSPDKSGGQASADAPKKEPRSAEPSEKSASEPKQKEWVDPVYETVEHPEEGHYESVVVGQRYFCLCGQEVSSPEGWKQHRADFIASNGGKCNGQHVSYSVEDVVEEQYVVDSPAWTEQVLVSEGHWE